MVEEKKPLNRTGLFYLLVVYFVWGSTYLAIRVAVMPGAGFTPFILGAMRALTGGLILFTWAALTHQKLNLNRRELWVLAASGSLLWLGGNGLVMVAEKRADSGLTALIIASTPLWVAIMEAVIDRKLPSLLMIASLLVGAIGVIVLTMPMILTGLRGDMLSVAAIIIGSICWGGGTLLQSRQKLPTAPMVSSSYQLLFGGIGFVVLALIFNEPVPQPTPQAWVAFFYLTLFGSVFAFTAFVQAIRLLPTKIVMTYGYVNPIIAVILGSLILGERITVWTIAGALLVLLGVYGVFLAHSKSSNEIQHASEVPLDAAD